MQIRAMRNFALLLPVLAIAGCGTVQSVKSTIMPTDEERAASMPNPASANCVRQGGRLSIQNESGGQVGYCHLPDGRVIEEWLLFGTSQMN